MKILIIVILIISGCATKPTITTSKPTITKSTEKQCLPYCFDKGHWVDDNTYKENHKNDVSVVYIPTAEDYANSSSSSSSQKSAFLSYFTWENIWGFLELPLTIFAAGATAYGQAYKQPTTTHTNCSKNLSGTEINCQSTNY